MDAFKNAGGDYDECNSGEVNDGDLNILEESLANLSLDHNSIMARFEEKENDIFEEGKHTKKVEAIFEPTFCSTKVYLGFL